jgi:hypothetical protein
VRYLHRLSQPESELADCSVSALERPVQILGGATVQEPHHAVTIETIVALPLSTGTVAASTKAFDHQPFNLMGQQVNPVAAGDGNGWGFWFLGQWIPL